MTTAKNRRGQNRCEHALRALLAERPLEYTIAWDFDGETHRMGVFATRDEAESLAEDFESVRVRVEQRTAAGPWVPAEKEEKNG